MLTDSQHCWLRWLEFSRGIRGSRNITNLEREFCQCFMLFPSFYVCSVLSMAAAATNATNTYACCDKTFFTTNICCDKDNTSSVATKVFRVCFCRDKNIFVTTNIILSRQVFSRQAYFCRDNGRALSRQTISSNKHVSVATKLLSRQR